MLRWKTLLNLQIWRKNMTVSVKVIKKTQRSSNRAVLKIDLGGTSSQAVWTTAAARTPRRVSIRQFRADKPTFVIIPIDLDEQPYL